MSRPKADPEPFWLFVGDLQVGSTTAVAPKAECRNREMEWHLAQWNRMVVRAKKAAQGTKFVLALGGDLIDGPRHHGNFQTWGTHREQRNAAIALLQPLANIAKRVVGVKGTEVHVGGDGEDDETVCEALGAKLTPYAWRLTTGGQRLFWTHHGVGIPREPHNMPNGMYRMAVRLSKLPSPPDVAIFHHCHLTPKPVTAEGVTVATVGCWQSSNGYGYSIRPEQPTDLGVLAWWPVQRKLEHWSYNDPERDGYQELRLS